MNSVITHYVVKVDLVVRGDDMDTIDVIVVVITLIVAFPFTLIGIMVRDIVRGRDESDYS